MKRKHYTKLTAILLAAMLGTQPQMTAFAADYEENFIVDQSEDISDDIAAVETDMTAVRMMFLTALRMNSRRM